MIDFSSGYSFSDILAGMLEQVDDSLDKREGSLIYTALAPVAWYLEGLALHVEKMQSASYVGTATGTDLDYYVANRGITRVAATPAVRQGLFDAVIPSGSVFKTVNGADSVLFTSGDLISASGGIRVYKMTCQTAGEIGNSYTGQIIPVTAIAGLTTASIGAIITMGTDEETDEALRARFFASLGSAPYGGNISEYRQAILAVPGVGGVQIYPANTYQGGGTVLCSIIDDDYEPATPALVATVQQAICPPDNGQSTPSQNGYGIAPIGAAVTITAPSQLTVNISFTASFATGITNGATTYHYDIVNAINEYITSVAKTWGDAVQNNRISYSVIIYAARVVYAILTVPEVVNVSNLKINNQANDLVLTETSALQQIPALGTVTING